MTAVELVRKLINNTRAYYFDLVPSWASCIDLAALCSSAHAVSSSKGAFSTANTSAKVSEELGIAAA